MVLFGWPFTVLCRVASELASLQPRLTQAERLARLEVELAAREAAAQLKVRRVGGGHIMVGTHLPYQA